MKCINRKTKVISIILVAAFSLTACSSKEYELPYSRSSNNPGFSISATNEMQDLQPFAADLCVTVDNVEEDTTVDMSAAEAAGLFDLNNGNVIYAKNVHEKLNPASITKVLTALCALKYGNLDDVLTASENVNITEQGAVKLGLEEGDTMTMDQALHALLLKSANDVAVLIAENVGGSIEGFADMMNEMAVSLGATNSHFVNPHGLTDPDHYTTAYDLYLICNEAIKYDKFVEIVHTSKYNSVYHDKNGNEKNLNLTTTNAYLKGEAFAPSNVTVIGGKTGTTNAAGSCLILYAKNQQGNSYISVILKSSDRTVLYQEMTELLGEIS